MIEPSRRLFQLDDGLSASRRGAQALSAGNVGLPPSTHGGVARLAVDGADQGAGLGTRLLAEALRMAVSAVEAAAARLVVVDALDEDAATFYRRHGFIAPLDKPLHLFRRMKDVRLSLDAAESGERDT